MRGRSAGRATWSAPTGGRSSPRATTSARCPTSIRAYVPGRQGVYRAGHRRLRPQRHARRVARVLRSRPRCRRGAAPPLAEEGRGVVPAAPRPHRRGGPLQRRCCPRGRRRTSMAGPRRRRNALGLPEPARRSAPGGRGTIAWSNGSTPRSLVRPCFGLRRGRRPSPRGRAGPSIGLRSICDRPARSHEAEIVAAPLDGKPITRQ